MDAGCKKLSYTDEKKLRQIYSIITSTKRKEIFMLFSPDKVFGYSELRDLSGIKGTGQANSGKFAYYVKTLRTNGLIKKEDSKYFLTRIGLTTLALINDFETICKAYYISDYGSDGKVKHSVKRSVAKCSHNKCKFKSKFQISIFVHEAQAHGGSNGVVELQKITLAKLAKYEELINEKINNKIR